eukprot:10497837-Alexandrium_andersonii.AAC.1
MAWTSDGSGGGAWRRARQQGIEKAWAAWSTDAEAALLEAGALAREGGWKSRVGALLSSAKPTRPRPRA